MGTEAVGHMREHPGPVLELDPEHPVRQRLDDPTPNETGTLGHER